MHKWLWLHTGDVLALQHTYGKKVPRPLSPHNDTVTQMVLPTENWHHFITIRSSIPYNSSPKTWATLLFKYTKLWYIISRLCAFAWTRWHDTIWPVWQEPSTTKSCNRLLVCCKSRPSMRVNQHLCMGSFARVLSTVSLTCVHHR